MTQAKLDWVKIDHDSLTPKQSALFGQWMASEKAAKAAKEQFKAEFLKDFTVPEGKDLRVGAMFGQLSVALADSDGRKTNAKPRMSLMDFIQGQANSGLRN
jgi:hypothetical protein